MDPSLYSPLDLDITPRKPDEASSSSAKPGNRIGYLSSTNTCRRPLGRAEMNREGSHRLKRLSLVSKPASLYHSADDAEQKENMKEKRTAEGIAGPSTPRRSTAMRNSISYSPAPRSLVYDRSRSKAISSLDRSVDGEETDVRQDGVAGITQTSRRIAEDEQVGQQRVGVRVRTKGETLVEKHAELLTMIAQKERRVNELREELAQQEASLSQLKSRWTSLITRQAPALNLTSPPSTSSHIRIRPSQNSSGHPLTSSHRSQAASMSVSSSTSSNLSSPSSASTNPDGPTSSIDHSIANLLSSIPGEALGVEEALEGGKRFWGNLVKTVSAAAGGTVPGPEEYARGHDDAATETGSGFDLSSLKSIAAALPVLPTWASSPIATSSSTSESAIPQPPQPKNASRLPGRSVSQLSQEGGSRVQSPAESGRSSASRTASLLDSPIEDLLGEEEGDMVGRGKVLTPKRGDFGGKALGGKKGKSELGETAKTRDEGEAGDESDGWGW